MAAANRGSYVMREAMFAKHSVQKSMVIYGDDVLTFLDLLITTRRWMFDYSMGHGTYPACMTPRYWSWMASGLHHYILVNPSQILSKKIPVCPSIRAQ